MISLRLIIIIKQIYSRAQMRQGVYSAPKYLYNYAQKTPETTKKWPEDIECIIKSHDLQRGSLYLSNVEAAQNPATVKKLRVGAILSCAKGYMVSHPTSLVPHYKYIPGEDKETFNISVHFDECIEFIREALEKTNIIVHCIAGVSRSASMVIAYFMKHKGLSFHQAFTEVKSKRKIISPNDGFIKHLKEYELKLKSTQSAVSTSTLSQSQTFQKAHSGQFYSPSKAYHYDTNFERLKSIKNPEYGYKNPELSHKQVNLNRNYYNGDKTTISPRANNYTSFTATKSYSMTFIPDESKMSPRFADRYGKSMSKQLSPRKDVSYTSEKPSYISRESIYQQKKEKNGYFKSMHEDLNEKYQAIRKKYEEQIQQLSKNRNATRGLLGHSNNENKNSSSKDAAQSNIYLDRKPIYEDSIGDRGNYYKNQLRRETFHMYDRNMDQIDLKNNPRLSNFDSIYIPRIPTGYPLGAAGYYPKRY